MAVVPEQLAPGRIAVKPDYLTVGNEYLRVLEVKGYPRQINVGWLAELVTFPAGKVDVSLHIHPVSKEAAVGRLNTEINKLETEVAGRIASGRSDVGVLRGKVESAEWLRARLTNRETNLFSVSLYIIVRTGTKDELDKLSSQVISILKGRMVVASVASYRQDMGFRAYLPSCSDILQSTYGMDTDAATSTFPFISSTHVDPAGVLYGISLTNSTPVLFNRFGLENYNTVIFGQSGSGKSYAAKLEVLRTFLLDPECSIFIIDPMHEFEDLTNALGGQHVRIGSQKDIINPFDLDTTGGNVKEKVAGMKVFFNTVFENLTSDDNAVLDTAVLETFTVNFNPTMKDLQKTLSKMKNVYSQRLAMLLHPFVNGSLSFLNQKTTVNLSNRLITFDISNVTEDMYPALMFLILDFVYGRIRKNYHRKLILVDEAWLLMQKSQTAQFLANLSRHTRHFNTGLTLISQTAEDFLDNEPGRVVVKNSALSFLMRHRSVTDEMVKFYNLTEAERQLLLTAKTGTETGYATCLFIGSNVHIPLAVVSTSSEHELITTKPDELRERSEAEVELADESSVLIVNGGEKA